MNICIIGTGYVGLTTAAILAELNHHVICVDINEKKISKLANGEITIYEPGLEECVKRNKQRLSFTTDIKKAVELSEVIFITVGTPSCHDGSTNLSYLFSALDDISSYLTVQKVIVIKSTVPPGTNIKCNEHLIQKGIDPKLFSIVSNPEFLREGSAIYDSRYPDRIVIGIDPDDKQTLNIMKRIYHSIQAPWVISSPTGAEMIKYASNAFLATKISYINELSRICDAFDVDVTEVAKGMGEDQRIGPHFLQAGIGYGGSCFPKDLQALVFSAKEKGISTSILNAVQSVNNSQVHYFIEKVKENIRTMDHPIAILGVAFKPNTDDIRCSPAVEVIRQLHLTGYDIRVYDPEAKLPKDLEQIPQFQSPYEAINGSQALVIATDWSEHKDLDWVEVKRRMNNYNIFDGRNSLDSETIKKAGFKYFGVGRS